MEDNKEERTTNQDIIVTFYRDIQDLIVNCTLYENACKELEFTSGDNLQNTTDQQRAQLLTIVQQVRFFVKKLYVTYKAFENEDKKEIEEVYKEIGDEFIPKMKSIDKYAIEMNKYYIKQFLPNFKNSIKGKFNTLLTK